MTFIGGRPPIIVTGTGRCGTSTVARILHTRLGVAMAPSEAVLEGKVPANPLGTFEDVFIRSLHIDAERGRITLPEFRERMMKAAEERWHQPWGWKDPRASHVLGLHLQWFPGAIVIWCKRHLDAVTQSIHDHYGTDPARARRETARRNDQLRALLHHRLNVYPMDFDEHRDERELEQELRAILEVGSPVA